MKSTSTILLFIVLPLFVIAQDRQADSLILVEVYNQLDGPNWNDPEKWLTEAPIEEWKGIRIENNRVAVLELIQQNATGLFPDQITGLDELHTFEIRQGDISGEIPTELTRLTKLQRFILSATGIGGELPNIWTEFSNLKTLSISQGTVTGTLPDLPMGLSLVNFQGNQLSGQVPESWRDNDLGNINISFNQLTGNFDIFSTWNNLEKIDLDNNDWDPNTLPTWIDDDVNLNRFSCNDCNIYGDIPSDLDFSQHYDYEGMFLNNNQLSGDITLLFPPEDTESLLYLSVSNNNFEGEFPAHQVKGFSRLVLQFNNYSSITEFEDIFLNVFNIKGNKFTYESLLPVQKYVTNFDSIPMDYASQQSTLTADTLTFGVSSIVTMEAGDNHPNTVYEWLHNNQIIAGETTSQLTLTIDEPSDAGTYNCRMTNIDFPNLDLRRDFVRINWEETTAVNSIEDVGLFIYPNPTRNIIKIEMQVYNAETSFQIISNTGRIVKEGWLDESHNIDVEDLNEGMYYLIMQLGNQLISRKIIKL